MSKGSAVSYIVALILGMVVIGLLGYWLFVLGGQTGGTGATEICHSKQIAWCQQLISNGSPPSEGWESFAPGCDNTLHDKLTCQTLFGQTTTS